MTYPDFLVQSEYLLRIFIACICGGVIGYERENRNKVAGIRTHAIVSLGSALIVPREYDKVKLLEAIESSEGVSSVKL